MSEPPDPERTPVLRLDGSFTQVNLYEIPYIEAAPPTLIDAGPALPTSEVHRSYMHPEFRFRVDAVMFYWNGRSWIQKIRAFEVPRADPQRSSRTSP